MFFMYYVENLVKDRYVKGIYYCEMCGSKLYSTLLHYYFLLFFVLKFLPHNLLWWIFAKLQRNKISKVISKDCVTTKTKKMFVI